MALVIPLIRSPHYCWLLLAVLAFGAVDASAYDLAAGGRHTCALDDNGVTCWGYNGSGQTTVPASLLNPSAPASGHIAPEFGRPDIVLLGRGCGKPA